MSLRAPRWGSPLPPRGETTFQQPQTCLVQMFGSGVTVGSTVQTTTNEIFTTKYRWYNFIPKNLWEQYHNLSVVYFSVTVLMQLVPQITITFGKPTMLAPLIFVLTVGAVKDLSEDLKRGKADLEENERKCTRLCDRIGERQESVQWSTVQAGQVLQVFKGERIPADLLLLDSSDEGKKCYVETMNLDGETNLKQKAVELPEDWTFRTPGKGLLLDFEAPSADLYDFKGALMEDGQKHQSQLHERTLYGVGINSLLLRGSSLQQTDWVVGMAVYCGHDTRVMRNTRESRFKQSELDMGMNRMMVLVFFIQLLLCLTAALCNLLFESGPDWWSMWYLKLEHEKPPPIVLRYLQGFGRWFLLMNNMVPIAMPIGLTTVKLFQGWFIQWDTECEDKLSRRPAEVHTSQVLESLGQITHVFSDKTGTLTCNEMVYKACSVAGKLYGHISDEGAAADCGNSTAGPSTRQDQYVDFADVKLFNADLDAADAARLQLMVRFLLCHAACHTVTIEAASPGARLTYAASSPDELALVSAARELGLTLIESGQRRVVLEVASAGLERALQEPLQRAASGVSTLSVELLDLCEFDNDRKRMSVVAKLPSGQLVLLLKGADTSVLDLIDDKASVSCVQSHLQRLACVGLRTLCLACRDLGTEEHARWHASFQAALAAVSEDRMERVRRLAQEMETAPGLQLLGATAIEDRLQDDVPVTIEKLRHSGICVWVLTGDKLETAINIGKMCRLLTDSMVYMELANDVEELATVLAELRANSVPGSHQALTVTGQVLGVILAQPKLALEFYRLVYHCESVICCRVSPKQKADVVDLVKRFHQAETQELPVTLAIGDGANDVAMITAAHVGVGLSGKEGAQAARAADFAICQFRYLERLLLVHGRESYRRNSVFVSYNFYKNAVLCLPVLFAGFVMGFNGQTFYEELMYQCFNIVYTFLPVMVYAMTDRGVQKMSELQANPLSYLPGRHAAYFNRWIFCCWMSAACLQAAILSLAAYTLLGDGNIAEGVGRGDLWTMGGTMYLWVILCVNITLLRRLSSVSAPTLVVVVGCVLFHLPLLAVLDLLLGRAPLRGLFRLIYGEQNVGTWLATKLFLIVAFMVGECVLAVGAPVEASHSEEVRPAVSDDQTEVASLQRVSVGVSVKLVSQVSSWAYDEECSVTRKASIARARSGTLVSLGISPSEQSRMSMKSASMVLPERESLEVELSCTSRGTQPGVLKKAITT